MSTVIERENGTFVLLIHMTLKSGRDDSLIRLVRSAPPRGLAAVVREAMRSGTQEKNEVLYDSDDSGFVLPEIGQDI
jgi:hypothetical protein